MKKIRFVFFSSLLFLLSILHVNALSGTCYYDDAIFIGNTPGIFGGTDYGSFMQFKVEFDESKAKLFYKTNGEYQESDGSSMFPSIDLYSNKDGVVINTLTGNLSQPDVSNFLSLIQNNGNHCPSIAIDNQNYTVVFSNEKEACGNGSLNCSDVSKEELDQSTVQQQVKLTDTHYLSLPTDQLDNLKGIEFKLEMYSDNSKKFCARFKNNRYSCGDVLNADVFLQLTDGRSTKTVVLPSSEVDHFFMQKNVSQINNATFSAPSNFTVYEPNGIAEGIYYLTTDMSLAQGYYNGQAQEGTLGDNGDPDDVPIDVAPEAVQEAQQGGVIQMTSVEETGFTWSTISTGQICRSNNLKMPLKYIGWLISIGKILIPIIIIALGVMDFIKAAASLKQDELPKAIKTVLVRVLAGVIIFLVPTIVNFVFVFIDDWNEYSTSYSECTTCLFNPRKC